MHVEWTMGNTLFSTTWFEFDTLFQTNPSCPVNLAMLNPNRPPWYYSHWCLHHFIFGAKQHILHTMCLKACFINLCTFYFLDTTSVTWPSSALTQGRCVIFSKPFWLRTVPSKDPGPVCSSPWLVPWPLASVWSALQLHPSGVRRKMVRSAGWDFRAAKKRRTVCKAKMIP